MIRKETNQHLRRTRPARVVNKWANHCRFNLNVANFYAPELEELGIDIKVLSIEGHQKLDRAGRIALTTELIEKFSVLTRSGTLLPEALYLSCTRPSRQLRRESKEQYYQRVDSPYFALLLDHYLPVHSYERSSVSSILSLGCGVDYEAPTLRQHFRTYIIEQPLHVGVDRDEDKIRQAALLNSEDAGYHYVVGDFDQETTHQEISKINTSFDLLVMRHAPIWKMDGLWYRNLDRFSGLLRKGGMLLMTIYYDEEYNEVISKGLPPGFEVETIERNRTRAFNHRFYTDTIFNGFVEAFSKSPNTEDNYFLWVNSQLRDQYLVLARKS